MLPRLVALAWLAWPALLAAQSDADDLDALTAALSSTIGNVVAEQEALLHYTQEDEGTQETAPPAPAGESEEERSCSRAGLLRSLQRMEQRFLKPWELCTGCNGDLLLMFDIKCFEPDDVAPTSTLVQLMPEAIRDLLERPGIQVRFSH